MTLSEWHSTMLFVQGAIVSFVALLVTESYLSEQTLVWSENPVTVVLLWSIVVITFAGWWHHR